MSYSDDDTYKKKYEDFINKCHNIADLHEYYCDKNCFKDKISCWLPHTKRCIDYRKEHCESFVKCNSPYCIKKNKELYLKPSYTRQKKQETITELTYYSSDDDKC
jgi:hypothetical protein